MRASPDPGRMRRPGRLLTFLLERRLSPSQRVQVLSELEELHEYRVRREGSAAGDRWLRGEYRRWGARLLMGSVRVQSDGSFRDAARGALKGLGIFRDVLYNLRGLRRTPLLAGAIILTVGVGIGGTTLVYSVVHAVLISPLPYPGSERMVLLRTVRGDDQWGTSMADLDALADPPPAFEGIAGYTRRTSSVGFGRGMEIVNTKWVTDSYFPLLGIEPLQGRHFTRAEGSGGGERVALITERFRDRAFGVTTEVLGRTIAVDGDPFAVVGVLPNELGPLDRIDVFPALQVQTPTRKGPFFFPIVGRLRDGVPRTVAREQLGDVAERMYPRWADGFPFPDATLGFVDLKEMVVGNVARTLLVVLIAMGFLLFIASANAASLLVARGMTRQLEVSIRSALGASAGRLLRLAVVEAGLLAMGGGILGGLVAGFGMSLVRRAGTDYLPRAAEVAFSPNLAFFFIAAVVSSWVLFGLVASVTVLQQRTAGLASAASKATPPVGTRRLRRSLVTAQFAVSVPLLIGAGLLGLSLKRLQGEDLGFDPANLASVSVSLAGAAYSEEGSVRRFWDELLPELEAVPGVVRVGLANARPPVEYPESNNFKLEDDPSPPDAPTTQAPWITANRGYLETLGVRQVEGRIFNDITDTLRAAVVDQAWAERFLPGQSAVGKRFRSGGCTIEGCPWIEVSGVVSDVKTTGLDDAGQGTIYFDFRRSSSNPINLHFRTLLPPTRVMPEIRRILQRRDPSIALGEMVLTDDLVRDSLVGRRYMGFLVTLVAGVALLLSVVGIYGALAHFVRQHVRDIGIRIALGGGPAAALRMVVLQGMRVAVVGTALGVAASVFLTRYLTGLLYGVDPTSPVIFGAVSLGTLAVALLATVIPGRQAAATDPANMLRQE